MTYLLSIDEDLPPVSGLRQAGRGAEGGPALGQMAKSTAGGGSSQPPGGPRPPWDAGAGGWRLEGDAAWGRLAADEAGRVTGEEQVDVLRVGSGVVAGRQNNFIIHLELCNERNLLKAFKSWPGEACISFLGMPKMI